MKNIIDYLKKINEADYFDNVNLHIHTNFSDGILSPLEVIENARKNSLKLISITDHNSIEAYKHIPTGNLDDLKIITGVEFDCWYKSVLLHILGYGFDTKNEKIKAICAKDIRGSRLDISRFFNNRSAYKVIRTIKEAGGISVLAHPACCWSLNLRKMIEELKLIGLDGIEVYYPYSRHRGIIKFYSKNTVKKIAQEPGYDGNWRNRLPY